MDRIDIPEGSNGQERTTGQFPRDSLRFFTLHAALRNPVSPLPSNDSPGATQGENVSVYPDRREIPPRVWSGSQRDGVNGAGILASVYLSIGNIAPPLYTLSLLIPFFD